MKTRTRKKAPYPVDSLRQTIVWTIFFIVLVTVVILINNAFAQGASDRLTGRASVIDGDTIEIQGQRIRLHGIDAPESGQRCEDAKRKAYRCGKDAAFFLDDMLKGRVVSCEARDIDRYKRIIGACTVKDTAGDVFDINATMVRAGHALAYRRYSKDYVSYEDLARSEQRGIWAGSFMKPWDWRKVN